MANESGAVAPKKKRSIGRWFKEVFSELKKVSWPGFAKVIKQLSVVIAVVVFFLLVLMGMDALLGWLYKLLTSGLVDPAAPTEAVRSVLNALARII